DKVQEIRFYISQGFWDMAQAGIHDLAETAPDYPNLDQLRADVAAGEAEAARAAEAARVAAAEAARAEEAARRAAVEAGAAKETAAAKAAAEAEAARVAEAEAAAAKAKSAPAKPAAAAPAQEPEEDILGDLVEDLEKSLGDFVPAGAPQPHPGPVHQ